MAKADVLQLVADLSNSRADQTVCGDYYDQLVDEMGRSKLESMVTAELAAVTAADGSYSYPTAAIALLAVIHDDKQLMQASEMDVETSDDLWRETQGTPICFVIEDEDARVLQLYPTPARAGDTIGASTPFVLPHPAGNLTYIYTERRATEHAYETLWMALEVLAREFSRDSNHQDLKFAAAARAFANVLKTILMPMWTNG